MAHRLLPTLSTTVVSSTTVPKVTLSYKWSISDAQVFLQHCKELRSLTFSLFLPVSKADRHTKDSSWHLLIEKGTRTEYSGEHPRTRKSVVPYVHISLCQGDKDISKYEPKRSISVLMSGCVFSLLNPGTGEILCSRDHSRPCWLEINKSVKTCCKSTFQHEEFFKCIIDDVLTIQVNATLRCCADPVETLDVVSDVMVHIPPDDIQR